MPKHPHSRRPSSSTSRNAASEKKESDLFANQQSSHRERASHELEPLAAKCLDRALSTLREGGVILYPTDTIWGIGCDATDPAAVERVFRIKRRADSKSLVLLASSLDMVARYVRQIPPIAVDLVEINDKPMTIVYPGAICAPEPTEGAVPIVDKHFLARSVVAEDGSVGIRIPMTEWCRQLAFKLGRPVVSTSANISGEPSPNIFDQIPQEIRDAVDYIVAQKLEKESLGTASQIIKVGLDGQVQVIRG